MVMLVFDTMDKKQLCLKRIMYIKPFTQILKVTVMSYSMWCIMYKKRECF